MESPITLILIITVVIQVIMIITFFVMASNIASIKKRLTPSGYIFRARFYSLILDGDNGAAKSLLFESISKENCFIEAVSYQSERLINDAQKDLSLKYQNELKALGIESFDFTKLKELFK